MEKNTSKKLFVTLTYETLSRTDLTLSEKVILDYRNGFKNKFWAGNNHMSEVLGIPLKTVKNCITSLRKKGLWREVDQRPKKGMVSPKKGFVTDPSSPKTGSEKSLNGVYNKLISPMKTDLRLDSDKIENPEESLESHPSKNGLDNDPQTFGLKNTNTQSQGLYTITKTEENRDTSTLGDNYPRDSNGRRLTMREMLEANGVAVFDKDLPPPYSENEVGRGLRE